MQPVFKWPRKIAKNISSKKSSVRVISALFGSKVTKSKWELRGERKMSGATKMYALKPIITRNEATNRKCCMYEMKNIHGTSRNSDDHACEESNIVTDISEQKPLPEVEILEARQEKILALLAELKEQVLTLCDVFKFAHSEETSTAAPVCGEPVLLDLVINVNPQKHCYAIQALQKIWKDVNFRVTAYKHSSVLEDVPEIQLPEKRKFRDTVNISLIWKKVEDLEVVLSGVHGYPLIGESNLLRYITRQLPRENYEKSLSPRDLSTLDSVLDLAHRLSYQETAKDVQSTLASIGEKLGKNNWFCNAKSAGIADVAVWSAFKKTSVSKPPSSLSSWFDRCEKQFLN